MSVVTIVGQGEIGTAIRTVLEQGNGQTVDGTALGVAKLLRVKAS